MDLRTAFDAVSQGEDYVDREALKVSFSNLGIFPSEEMLDELLNSIGKLQEDDMITFEVFSRCVALLLEENAEKVSTSSQQNMDEMQEEY
jgi:Ca2+-binding EF-hand superfamily protein